MQKRHTKKEIDRESKQRWRGEVEKQKEQHHLNFNEFECVVTTFVRSLLHSLPFQWDNTTKCYCISNSNSKSFLFMRYDAIIQPDSHSNSSGYQSKSLLQWVSMTCSYILVRLCLWCACVCVYVSGIKAIALQPNRVDKFSIDDSFVTSITTKIDVRVWKVTRHRTISTAKFSQIS